MRKIALTDTQLNERVASQPILQQYYEGTYACDELPRKPVKNRPAAYIVNTDPAGQPGEHWIALWTHDGVCEIFDSYAVPLDVYGEKTTDPLYAWLEKWWKMNVRRNAHALQSLSSKSCGDYAFFFLLNRAQGKSMNDFQDMFTQRDYKWNNNKIGRMLEKLIVDKRKFREKAHQFRQSTRLSQGICHYLYMM